MQMPSCPICRTPVSPKMRFCVACGAPIPAQTETETAAVAAETVAPTTAVAPCSTSEPVDAATPAPLPQLAGNDAPITAMDTASHGRTGADALREPVAVPFSGSSAEDDASDTLKVFVHFPHVPVAGHGSLLQLAVENVSALPLEHILVRAESRGLAAVAERQISRIAPGATARMPLEIEAGRAGQHEIRFEIRLVQAGQQLAFLGSRSWRVMEVPSASNFVVNISELQKINGASNAGLGSEFGAIQIGNLFGEHAPKTLNDLLSAELPEEFQRLPLELDYSVSVAAQTVFAARHGAQLTLPRQFVGAVQTGTLAILTPTAPDTAVPVRLTARDELRLGRSRADCDIVTWLLPRSEANDERTRHVSKVQATITATADGIHIRDTGSANGTCANGSDVGPAEPGAPLGDRTGLFLGNEYELELVTHASGFPQGPDIAGLRLWPGPAAQPKSRSGGVQFYPGNCEAMVHECAWVFTDVSFGSSRAGALVVPGAGVAELQGRFHHFRGCFWIENSCAEGTVAVNGQRLQLGDIVPLVTGQIVTLGATEYRVAIEK